MKKIYVLLVLLAVLLISSVSYSFLKPKYPDIWGYQLEDTKLLKLRKNSLLVYKTDKGEIYFIINKSREEYQDSEGITQYKNKVFQLLNFFTGETKEINSDQLNSFKKDYHAKWIDNPINPQSHKFSNGNSVEWEWEWNGHTCALNSISNTLSLKDPQGKILKKVVVYMIYDEPLLQDAMDSCEYEDGTAPKIQIYSLIDNFVFLDDDSFILYGSSGSNTILRMDKNLETKFVSNHEVTLPNGKKLKNNVFIIPYDDLPDLDTFALTRSISQDIVVKYLSDKYGE